MLVVSNKIEWKYESKYALFNRKNYLWECKNYLTCRSSACAFATCHQWVTDQMISEAPKNKKGGSSRRTGRNRTQCRLIKLRLLMFICLYCRAIMLIFV